MNGSSILLGRRAEGNSGQVRESRKSPMLRIEKAAVLGAGTMGAQIAAHLANAGVPTLLLDIVPHDSERVPAAGSQDRNAIARAGLEAAKKAKPAAFFTADRAALVSIGNFEDDLARLKD